MDVNKYSSAGVDTYAYYLDFDGKDFFFSSSSQPAGLPHGTELLYTFGAYNNTIIRDIIQMGEIKEWEYEVAHELGSKINNFINNGIGWIEYKNNEAIYVVRNNETNALLSVQYGTADTIRSPKVSQS